MRPDPRKISPGVPDVLNDRWHSGFSPDPLRGVEEGEVRVRRGPVFADPEHLAEVLARRARHDAPRASEPSPVERPHILEDELARVALREPPQVVKADDAVALREEALRPPAEPAEQIDAEGVRPNHLLKRHGLPGEGGRGAATGNTCEGSNGQRHEKASQSWSSQDGYSGIGPHMKIGSQTFRPSARAAAVASGVRGHQKALHRETSS